MIVSFVIQSHRELVLTVSEADMRIAIQDHMGIPTSSAIFGRKKPPILSVSLSLPIWKPKSARSSSPSSPYTASLIARGVGSRSLSSSGSGAKSTSSSTSRKNTGRSLLAPLLAPFLATSCSSTLSRDPIFSLISVNFNWVAESNAGARKRQSREFLVQLAHGCCLSHFNFLLRHSRQDVIIRFLRRIRGAGPGEGDAAAPFDPFDPFKRP